MKLKKVNIKHYRSIEDVSLKFPDNKPLILFGPNNAGKSNILSAIDRALGEKFPTYIELLDSDYFLRDKTQYPRIDITCSFDEDYYSDKYGNNYKNIFLTYGYDNDVTKNLLHDGEGRQLYISTENRCRMQSCLIDAERNIQAAFNYSSKYSMLSKFSHRIHDALSSAQKSELSSAFETIKTSFTSTPEFSSFFETFCNSLKNSVKGFVHSLEVDFSAYDPNNYAKSIRIFAKEGNSLRSFEEFGTGEQQVLLMAFIKAYMETFTSESFVLVIEEPEAHLHPLAQRWLKEYIFNLCENGIQVVISTHSTEFIDSGNLSGLVRVYKENGITNTIQLTPETLCQHCIECGAPADRVTPENISDFYETKLFSDQLKGVFAEKIILVEGATEYFALPYYLKKAEYLLSAEGTEIVNCRGKDAIPLFYRLFTAFGYKCYCLFDGDASKKGNTLFQSMFGIDGFVTNENQFVSSNIYGYFGKDFESYLNSNVESYSQYVQAIKANYSITSKPGIAKAVAQTLPEAPDFICNIVSSLKLL